MDKYEFKLKVDEMKALVSARNYKAAAEIAETINWRKIRNLNALVLAGEIFEQVGQFDHSKEILLMAYDKSPIGRNIIYRLAEIAIKTKNFDDAREYYDEFVDIAPHDNLKYVLKYKMTAAQGLPFEDQIKILEELKEQEYSEEWAYELALLYHKAGQPEKCVDACDELILWFGDGIYVEKALELKLRYQPLDKKQQEKYRLFRQKRAGVIEVKPHDANQPSASDTEELSSDTAGPSNPADPPHTTASSGPADTFLSDAVSKKAPDGFQNRKDLQDGLESKTQQIQPSEEKEAVSDAVNHIGKMVMELPHFSLSKYRKKQKHPYVPVQEDVPVSESRKSIGELMNQWEKTEQAAQEALKNADPENIASAKEEILKEAEKVMQRLLDVIPQFPADADHLQDVNGYEEMEDADVQDDIEQAGRIVAGMNMLLQEQINSLLTEKQAVWPPVEGTYSAEADQAYDRQRAYADSSPDNQQRPNVDLGPDSQHGSYVNADEGHQKSPYVDTTQEYRNDTYMDQVQEYQENMRIHTGQGFPDRSRMEYTQGLAGNPEIPYTGREAEFSEPLYQNTEQVVSERTYKHAEQELLEESKKAGLEFQNVPYRKAETESEEKSAIETGQKIQGEVQGMDPGQKMQEQPVVMETGIQRVKQAMLAGARRMEQESTDETGNHAIIQQQTAVTGVGTQQNETETEAASSQKAATASTQNVTGMEAAARQKAESAAMPGKTGIGAAGQQAVGTAAQNKTGIRAAGQQAVGTAAQNKTGIRAAGQQAVGTAAQDETGAEAVRQNTAAEAGTAQKITGLGTEKQQKDQEIPVMPTGIERVRQAMRTGARNIQQKGRNVESDSGQEADVKTDGNAVQKHPLQEKTELRDDTRQENNAQENMGMNTDSHSMRQDIQQELPEWKEYEQQNNEIYRKLTAEQQNYEVPEEKMSVRQDDQVLMSDIPIENDHKIPMEITDMGKNHNMHREMYLERQDPDMHQGAYPKQQDPDMREETYPKRQEAYAEQTYPKRQDPDMYQETYPTQQDPDMHQGAYPKQQDPDMREETYPKRQETYAEQIYPKRQDSDMYQETYPTQQDPDMHREVYEEQHDPDMRQEMYEEQQNYGKRQEAYTGQQDYELYRGIYPEQRDSDMRREEVYTKQRDYDIYRENMRMQTTERQQKAAIYADAGEWNDESDIRLERYEGRQKDLDQGQEKNIKQDEELKVQTEHQAASVMDQNKKEGLQKTASRAAGVSPGDLGIKQLTPERKEIFSYFVPISGMEAQIYDLLEGVANHLQFDKNSISGNFIVEGIKGSGKTVLITDIIKVLQKELKRPNGKIGRIDANVLNQKELNVLTEKVSGGCLIIESAGKISRETAVKLSRCMDMDRSGTLYILEDTEQGIQKALDRDSSFSAKFTEKISIPSFSIDELAEFGRAYANDLNYDIDDMGILALYKRINNIQKLNHVTTLTEVKEIVDEAIDKAEKGALKKVLGILTSTRYNDDNYVILREKDFE